MYILINKHNQNLTNCINEKSFSFHSNEIIIINI